MLEFVKMDGAGNDFVALDGRRRPELADGDGFRALVRRLCDRHHGVGADGVLVLDSPSDEGTDFAMRYYNADGSRGEMCGNGARCIAVFAHRVGAGSRSMRFSTDAGLYAAEVDAEEAEVRFPDLAAMPEQRRPASWTGPEPVFFLLVGVPHAVLFPAIPHREAFEALDVAVHGHALRHDPAFAPAGANINFAWKDPTSARLYVRTYERGVEAETLACGTGSVATVCTMLSQEGVLDRVVTEVVPTGGDVLRITLTLGNGGFSGVWLGGPARIVFEGRLPDWPGGS